MFSRFIQHLKQQLATDLPGNRSHRRMIFEDRRPRYNAPATAMQAGVMILLYPKDSGIHLIYIKRKAIEGDVHKGQISFPGGKYEIDDFSLKHTAIRETYEEIGVSVPETNIIGALTSLYIPVSNFAVHPFVGFVDEVPDFRLEVAELDDILEVELDYIQDPAIIMTKDIPVHPDLVLRNVPYFDLEGHTLWGATAMMTAEFLDLLRLG